MPLIMRQDGALGVGAVVLVTLLKSPASLISLHHCERLNFHLSD